MTDHDDTPTEPVDEDELDTAPDASALPAGLTHRTRRLGPTAPALPPPDERKPVEAWAKDKGHAAGRDAWKFAAARAHARWVEGEELTEAEYDAAVQAAGDVTLGYDHRKAGTP